MDYAPLNSLLPAIKDEVIALKEALLLVRGCMSYLSENIDVLKAGGSVEVTQLAARLGRCGVLKQEVQSLLATRAKLRSAREKEMELAVETARRKILKKRSDLRHSLDRWVRDATSASKCALDEFADDLKKRAASARSEGKKVGLAL